MKKEAKKTIAYIREHLFEVIDDYDWDEELTLSYEPVCGKELEKVLRPINKMISEYPEWIEFTLDEEGMLNCKLPEVDQEIMISDGENVWLDTFVWDEEGYYLDRSNCELIGLAWMALPKPHNFIHDLAVRIDDFTYDNDTYEYLDCDCDKKSNIEEIEASLKSGEVDHLIDYFKMFIAEGGLSSTINEAIELLEEIKKYA